MRHTLSALTAVCLLALGQSSWAAGTDRTWIQHARHIVHSLPESEQARAKLLLEQWHMGGTKHQMDRPRRLPFHRTMAAIEAALALNYQQRPQSYLLPPALVEHQWVRPEIQALIPSHTMELDPAMVQRWDERWQLTHAHVHRHH